MALLPPLLLHRRETVQDSDRSLAKIALPVVLLALLKERVLRKANAARARPVLCPRQKNAVALRAAIQLERATLAIKETSCLTGWFRREAPDSSRPST